MQVQRIISHNYRNSFENKRTLSSQPTLYTYNNQYEQSQQGLFGFRGKSLNAQKAISYIRSERLKRPINSIYDLAPDKIDGILDGIDIFKGIRTEDLYMLPGTIDILTQRGCSNSCLHCFVKARNKFSTMNWEDFTRFTGGMKELKERLGFQLFEIRREKYDANRRDYTLSQGLYPYLDADPIEIRSLDKDGKVHNIADFVKQFYVDLDSPLKVKTVGWDINNEYAQKAAVDLAALLTDKKYRDACPAVIISMHPFHKIMTNANNALRKANGNKNDERYLKYRNAYIARMSNVLKTFLPLARAGKLLINAQYAVGGLDGSGYTKTDSKKLCADILKHLEAECIKEGIDSSILTAQKDIEKNPFFEPINQILSVARAKKHFLNDMSANTYSFEKDSEGRRSIIVSPFDIKHAFGNEVSENIVNNITHQKDFIENVVINIDPINDSDLYVANKNRLSSHRADMFMEKILYTIKRFGMLDNLVLRLSYREDSVYDKKYLGQLLTEIENRTGRTFQNVEYKISDNHRKNSMEAFLEIINNLNPEGKVRFISQLRKGINVDGQFYIPIINTRSFGEDYFENRAAILKGVKLNYLYPQRYIFDNILPKNALDFDRSEVGKLRSEV